MGVFHKAIDDEDYELVCELIDEEEDMEDRDSAGRTAFLHAAFRGETEILKLLYEEGADIDAVDYYSRSAVHLAAKENHVPALEYLIEELELNFIASDNYGRQPHHLAAYRDSPNTLELLLDYECVDVDAPDMWLRTPLHIACKENSVYCLEILVSYGAYLHARDNMRRQAHHLAALLGAAECLQIILDNYIGRNKLFRLNARDNRNRTPLHLAYKRGHEECWRLLLDYGADPYVEDDDGCIPEEL